MKAETWVIFGCVLVGLSSFRYGALQAASVALTESGLRQKGTYTPARGPIKGALTKAQTEATEYMAANRQPTESFGGGGGEFGGGGASDSY